MAMRRITVNGRSHDVEAPDLMPLLWVLRDLLGLTGTKYGCGIGACGACTVLDGDEPVRSCQVTFAEAVSRSYTTIEGLSEDGSDPCQQAWLDAGVSQCGYCQPGMILELKALLRRTPRPTTEQVDEALADHVCRCGSYPRIRKAARLAADAEAKR